MTGKAAILSQVGSPMTITEFPLPKVEPGAILVRVSMANICGSDIHVWHGKLHLLTGAGPWILGHEMVGRVEELGPGVTTDSLQQPLSVGARIVYPSYLPCGRCHACLREDPINCTSKFVAGSPPAEPPYFFNGAYSEYFYVRPGQQVFKVPQDLSDETVAPINCALSQAAYGLHKVGITLGDTVVVQGAGGLGLNACAIAKEMGAGRVIALDMREDRLQLARSFGADYSTNLEEYPSSRDRIAQIRELTQGRGADIVVEVTGSPAAFPEGINMLRLGGTFLAIGNVNRGQMIEVDPSAIVTGNRRVIGVLFYEPWIIPRLLELLRRAKNKYPFERIVSAKFRLEEINEAFQEAASGKVSRASILP